MDVEVPGGERGNVQTDGGDRVSTISLLGCSTSVALAMGPPTEEGGGEGEGGGEEEEEGGGGEEGGGEEEEGGGG